MLGRIVLPNIGYCLFYLLIKSMDLRSKVLFVLIIYSAFVCGGFFATLVNKVGNAQEVKIEAQVQEYNVFFPKEYPNAFCVNKNPTK